MPVKAFSKSVGIPPKRLQPYVEAVRGMGVQAALDALRFLPSPAAAKLGKTIKSAAANAENNLMLDIDNLVVANAFVDQGPVMKRFRARARGRVGKILRHSCHITVVVDERGA
jgi:large subunit ribosomal protein L22